MKKKPSPPKKKQNETKKVIAVVRDGIMRTHYNAYITQYFVPSTVVVVRGRNEGLRRRVAINGRGPGTRWPGPGRAERGTEGRGRPSGNIRKSGIIISFLIIQDRSETLIKSVTNKNTGPSSASPGRMVTLRLFVMVKAPTWHRPNIYTLNARAVVAPIL